MESSDVTENEDEHSSPLQNASTKKRKVFGRISDSSKRIRAMSHVTGDDCKCSRLKCFQNIPLIERNRIIKEFNQMASYDTQNAHLTGLISVNPVRRRRPKKCPDEAACHDFSYVYKVRINRDGQIQDVQVCQPAFLALHGITNRRLITLKKSLATTGKAHVETRGKHNNRPKKLKGETVSKIHQHIQSLRGRKAHYSIRDSKRLYLSEDLNIRKLHQLYSEKNPENPVSYEQYRLIFVNHYNISFGYPRTDTCSICDKFRADISKLDLQINNEGDATKIQNLNKQKQQLTIQNELHKRKGDMFYEIKRTERLKSRKCMSKEAICMDFQKNLPIPNISTSEVYYRRQLSFYSFNVHTLSTGKSVFYTYDETVSNKGPDEVCSMLWHFCSEILPDSVRELNIFCDSCSGQNKNFTVFRFCHFLVHVKKRFDRLWVTFPARGHSYLECDKNMGLINQKASCELPDDWRREIVNARKKPEPFIVVDCKQEMFHRWGEFLNGYYRKKCPFAQRSIAMYHVKQDTKLVFLRQSYSGPYESYMITQKKSEENQCIRMEMPQQLNVMPLFVKRAKFNDLQIIKQFCSPSAQEYFASLPVKGNEEEKSDSDSEDMTDKAPRSVPK